MKTKADLALELIISNPRHLTAKGHALINASIKQLLADKRVVYAPNRAVGYKKV